MSFGSWELPNVKEFLVSFHFSDICFVDCNLKKERNVPIPMFFSVVFLRISLLVAADIFIFLSWLD